MERRPLWMVLAAGTLSFVTALVVVPRFKAANPKDSDVRMQVLAGAEDLAADVPYWESDFYLNSGVTGGCQDEAPEQFKRDIGD